MEVRPDPDTLDEKLGFMEEFIDLVEDPGVSGALSTAPV